MLGDTNILSLDTISIFLTQNTRYFDISIQYSQVYSIIFDAVRFVEELSYQVPHGRRMCSKLTLLNLLYSGILTKEHLKKNTTAVSAYSNGKQSNT